MERIDPGIASFVTKAKEQRQQLKKQLEMLPFECQEISGFELRKILEVKKILVRLIEAYDNAIARGADSKTKQDYFDQTLKHLDQFTTLWDAKFTTADADDKNPNNYSVYYMTKSGVSLRMKRINLEAKGLRAVAQPLMEKIVFEIPENNYISDQPIIGGTVQEYVSPEFLKLQEQDEIKGPFKSRIRRYVNCK